MFDYKKILDTYDFKGKKLEIGQSCGRVDIGGNIKGLLYFACRVAEFVLEECVDGEFAEDNLDPGIDLTEDSSSLCVFLTNNWD